MLGALECEAFIRSVVRFYQIAHYATPSSHGVIKIASKLDVPEVYSKRSCANVVTVLKQSVVLPPPPRSAQLIPSIQFQEVCLIKARRPVLRTKSLGVVLPTRLDVVNRARRLEGGRTRALTKFHWSSL